MKDHKQKDDNVIKGRWWKIKNKTKEIIPAEYDKIKEWVMDPKGYFLIRIDREGNLIRVGYCIFSKLGNDSIHDMIAEITGKTAIEPVFDANYIADAISSICKMPLNANVLNMTIMANDMPFVGRG